MEGGRKSGVERVYETLRREILTLELEPSAPLDETALSARFELSRTPIREALVRLASERLVRSLPNRGAIVAPLGLGQIGAYFDALTLLQRVTTRLAARNHSAPDLEAVQSQQQRFAAAVHESDVLAMIEVNRDFHVAIAEAGNNTYYTDFYSRILDEGKRILRLYYASFHDQLPYAYVEEHERIIEAMKARDEEEADRLAHLHAKQVIEQIRSFITSGVGGSISFDPLEP